MDQHTSEETQTNIRNFRKAFPSGNAVEGLIRLPNADLDVIILILKKFTFAEAWCVSEEKDMDGDGKHYHFVIYNKKRKIGIQPIRAHFKEYLGPELGTVEPGHKWQNGHLNIGRVEDSFKILAYILKEQEWGDISETWEGCSLSVEILKLAIQLSYRKVKNMGTEIINFYKAVQLHILTPTEATIKYILMRNKALKPDPYWKKFYLNCEMIALKNETEITTMVEAYYLEWNSDSTFKN